jgi:hypothetical protein
MEAGSCKTILIAFAFSISGIGIQAQNLVANSSFETTTSCPDDLDQLGYAAPWVNPTANTPDYFNSCASSNAGVPANVLGVQNARTGQAYAGIGIGIPTPNDERREYIQCKLTDTLLAGKKYCVEFFVSLSDSSMTAIDRIGMYFSSAPIHDYSTINYLDHDPQIESPAGVVITETVDWYRVSGFITATGGETYITIGNFHSAAETSIGTMPGTWYGAYYYIDDVSVIEIADCIAGTNTTISTNDSLELGGIAVPGVTYAWMPETGLSDPTAANPKASPSTTTTYTLTQTECNVISTSIVTVTVHPTRVFIPNPVLLTEQLTVIGLEPHSMIEIFDMQGRALYKSDDYQNDFWLHQLSVGVYIVNLTRPNGEVLQRKLSVIK